MAPSYAGTQVVLITPSKQCAAQASKRNLSSYWSKDNWPGPVSRQSLENLGYSLQHIIDHEASTIHADWQFVREELSDEYLREVLTGLDKNAATYGRSQAEAYFELVTPNMYGNAYITWSTGNHIRFKKGVRYRRGQEKGATQNLKQTK